MAAPTSNAIAQVTILDQDLLSAAQTNLVQRLAATVTLPVPNTLIYSGYMNVTSAAFLLLLPAGQFSPFVYIRNANDPTSQNALVIQTQQQGGATNITQNLLPGGIFLFANSSLTTASPFSSYQDVEVAVFSGAPVVMEYMIVY
jgi:hypothetical protein